MWTRNSLCVPVQHFDVPVPKVGGMCPPGPAAASRTDRPVLVEQPLATVPRKATHKAVVHERLTEAYHLTERKFTPETIIPIRQGSRAPQFLRPSPSYNMVR